MYTDRNFKTKKALKEAVEAFHAGRGRPVTFYQPNDMSGRDWSRHTGTVYIEGPHYPEPHKWYAQCHAENGAIVKVK